jgi:hypothetical protein
MHLWLVLGILLAGCGVGALLTAAVYLTQLRKVKTGLQVASLAGPQSRSQVSPDPKDKEPEERSA